jgi:hypothetical protein
MARLIKEKLEGLKKAFIEEGMSPSQAAQRLKVTTATANRYYDKWSEEIKEELERRLIPKMQESIRQLAKNKQHGPRKRSTSKRTG